MAGLEAITVVVCAGLVSWLGVGRFVDWAVRRQILDRANPRSLHQNPTPRGAGLVIVAVTLGGTWLHHLLSPQVGRPGPLLAYTAGGVLVATVSWYDDRFGVRAWLRLAVHFLAAALVLFGIGYWQVITLPFVGTFDLGWFGAVVSFVWVVGLINTFNFMDGIDGIAGMQAIIAGTAWAILGWQISSPETTAIGLLLAAGSAGFLYYNWPPARVFMGDVGSTFLGYSLAVLPLVASTTVNWTAVIAVLLVWPFLCDGFFTFLVRLIQGENVLEAHRRHLYQRLVLGGHGHRAVTLVYSALALVGAVFAVGWSRSL